MKLLLDTHIWLWSLVAPDRLGRATAAALDDRAVEKWLSPISVWETLMAAERGRVTLRPDAETWVRAQLAEAPIREAPLTAEIALASRRFRLRHQDPADRFLLATALVHEATFVTADRRLRRVAGVSVLPNT